MALPEGILTSVLEALFCNAIRHLNEPFQEDLALPSLHRPNILASPPSTSLDPSLSTESVLLLWQRRIFVRLRWSPWTGDGMMRPLLLTGSAVHSLKSDLEEQVD